MIYIGRVYDKNNLPTFWHDMKPTNTDYHHNDEKKVTINTVDYTRSIKSHSMVKATAELRLPECLLDKTHIKNWNMLYVNFIDSMLCDPTPPENVTPANTVRETLQLLGLESQNDFFILSPDLHETKLWFLNKIIRSPHCESSFKNEAKEILDSVSLN
jgi:hypothetical protein